jgi:hypothetical protein
MAQPTPFLLQRVGVSQGWTTHLFNSFSTRNLGWHLQKTQILNQTFWSSILGYFLFITRTLVFRHILNNKFLNSSLRHAIAKLDTSFFRSSWGGRLVPRFGSSVRPLFIKNKTTILNETRPTAFKKTFFSPTDVTNRLIMPKFETLRIIGVGGWVIVMALLVSFRRLKRRKRAFTALKC